MKGPRAILVGGAPFIHERSSTAANVWWTILMLIPSACWGCLQFGWKAALVLAVSVLASLIADILQSALRRRFEVADGTAVLTGLLIGMFMPSGVPLFVPLCAAFFAILVVKGAFGGIGGNWMNPALAGIVFASLNWPDALRGTPASLNAAFSDSAITSNLNAFPFSLLGAALPDGYVAAFAGFRDGPIGGLSGLLLLLASTVLIGRGIVRWMVPASIFLSYASLEWIFGGSYTGAGLFRGDVLASALSGSFILVTFFMAPDPVTSPSRPGAILVYGLGIGAIAHLVSNLGTGAEAMAFAVILMNCIVPLLDRLNFPRPSGSPA